MNPIILLLILGGGLLLANTAKSSPPRTAQPLEPATGPGTPGKVTIPAHRRAQIIFTMKTPVNDTNALAAWISDGYNKMGGPGTVVEKVAFTPDKLQGVIVLTPGSDLPVSVNTPEQGGATAKVELL